MPLERPASCRSTINEICRLMWQKSRVQSMKHSICGIYAHCYPITAPVGLPGAPKVTPYECYGASGHGNAGKPSASRHLFSTHSLAGTASCFRGWLYLLQRIETSAAEITLLSACRWKPSSSQGGEHSILGNVSAELDFLLFEVDFDGRRRIKSAQGGCNAIGATATFHLGNGKLHQISHSF